MRNKNTLFIGKVSRHFHSLPSTNLYAQQLLAKSKPNEGTVITTDDQTAGRGQIGSAWVSEAGKNVAFSVILYPEFLAVRRQFLLNQAISLAVRDCIQNYINKPVLVKWPNDIYVQHRKIAGILLQNALAGSRLQSVIAGIGINVNQARFPEELPNPTSFLLETERQHDPDQIITALCHFLESRYLQLKRGEEAGLKKEYHAALYRIGEEMNFTRPDGQLFSGRIVATADDGRLLVQTAAGLESFALKEVRFGR